MTDKQIIIDGENIERIKTLLLEGQRDVISTKTFEAIIEALERKEQECERLKGLCNGLDTTIDNYTNLIELRNQQLDQLKAENEELKKQNNQFDNGINEQFSKIVELEGRNNLLKAILTEIKEIAKNGCYDDCGMPLDELSIILQKISECEGNDGL